jgi:outer membrane protein
LNLFVHPTACQEGRGLKTAASIFCLGLALVCAPAAHAETIDQALARAYAANPALNAQRAGVRALDENVPRALSGYRPRVNAVGDVGVGVFDNSGTRSGTDRFFPRGVGIQVDQNIFNGFQTQNSVRQADSNVMRGREDLRFQEQSTLLDGATAYMDVLRDTAVVDLTRNNIDVLQEQLRQTRDRFDVGEVTRTDVAQAEARLAQAQAEYSRAEGNLRTSIASYRRVIGTEPRKLAPAKPLDRLTPKSLEQAVAISQGEHPRVLSALHAVDSAALQVKIIEGELYPTLGVRGTVQQRWDVQSANQNQGSATLVGTLSIPIYEGGETYARARQAKETLGQARLNADFVRDEVRANVVSAWSALVSARERITAQQAQIQASEVALNGVREEAKVGQRTTLDVLNAQQELLSARVALVGAQRDRVVASYGLIAAMGKLSSATLALKVDQYSPSVHYDQVRDKWIGLRTPDGR